ncbi:MAG TPA: tyrosine-type recombinase/integrase [Planctomycetaceae bacterium]|jgi:integrase|nr:tyrosine-type recombinase/integrase [Planctomycetaceae bacterium]
MPRPKGIPAYKLHKSSGQARVILDGRHVYLGLFGSAESHERYTCLIADYLRREPTRRPATAAATLPAATLTISQLILAYWSFAKTYYSLDGEPTKELVGMRDALRPLRELFGRTPANKYGPKSLAIVRQHMISQQKLARTEINKRIGRIKRVFKWAVAEELVDSSVYHGLQALAGLRYGRTDARETEPVKPVADKDVDAILPFLSPQICTLLQLQRLTGMRPCEVVLMRGCDIDRSEDVWAYEPFTHKNRWRGHRRVVPLGPLAQELLRPFLERDPEAFLFSPKDAAEWRIQQQTAKAGRNRKTRIYPCELRSRELRKQRRRKRSRRRPPGDRYDTASYRRAIEYAIQRARKAGIDVMHWHPNQVRHAKATELRKQHGLEAAQVVLGHARADVTEVYAERNVALAREIAKQSG